MLKDLSLPLYRSRDGKSAFLVRIWEAEDYVTMSWDAIWVKDSAGRCFVNCFLLVREEFLTEWCLVEKQLELGFGVR